MQLVDTAATGHSQSACKAPHHQVPTDTLNPHVRTHTHTHRRLLARMCLVREEVRWLEQEQNFTGSGSGSGEASSSGRTQEPSRVSAAYFARTNVPQRCIAYLKVRRPAQTQSLGHKRAEHQV